VLLIADLMICWKSWVEGGERGELDTNEGAEDR
jgi:hypothetical protein